MIHIQGYGAEGDGVALTNAVTNHLVAHPGRPMSQAFTDLLAMINLQIDGIHEAQGGTLTGHDRDQMMTSLRGLQWQRNELTIWQQEFGNEGQTMN